jgi:hypothetical protein
MQPQPSQCLGLDESESIQNEENRCGEVSPEDFFFFSDAAPSRQRVREGITQEEATQRRVQEDITQEEASA